LKNLEQHKGYVAELAGLLTGGSIDEIDFDGLTQWLGEASALLENATAAIEEATLLRHDYRERISGMVKAIAVSSRRRENMQTALDYIEGLPHLSATELIAEYKKTQARFRDAFPASFTPGSARGNGRLKGKLEEFK